MFIPPVPDQDLHVTLSEARMREDGHQARHRILGRIESCLASPAPFNCQTAATDKPNC